MKTIKLFEEFKKNNIEINLGLELEKVSREGKKLTFQEFLDLFEIKSGDVDGKEMGKALMDQMKYRKLTDDEFNKLYNEYKGEELTKESLLGSIQFIALGYFIWKFIMSLIENKFIRDNQRLQDKLNRLNIKQILSYIKNINKIQVIDLQDRYFLRLPSVDGNSVDIRVMKEERFLSIDTIKGSFKLELTDDEYNEFISLLSKK